MLDFGLAKATEEAAPTPNSLSPTLSIMATNAGVILGTAGYMSPEQARGHATDQRSDIFSFACVFYEMLTGRRAFPGDTITDVIASIVARDPDWRALPPNLHPKTEELIRRCLAKNRKDRWHAIGDVRVELDTIMADPHGLELQARREASRQPLWRRALLPCGHGGGRRAHRGGRHAGDAEHTSVAARGHYTISSCAFRRTSALPTRRGLRSRCLPTAATSCIATTAQIYLRNLSELEPRPVQGTAPSDSRAVFFPGWPLGGILLSARSKLEEGGACRRMPAVSICEAGCDDSSFGFVWSSDDYIYMGRTKAIVRVSANGGKPEQVIALKDNETAYRPQLLPGGGALLFTLHTGDSSVARTLGHCGDRRPVIDIW